MTTLGSDTIGTGGFEERADQVEEAVLRDETVIVDHFDRVHAGLVAKGLVLIQGPRGCGKTHLMRYTWLTCREDSRLPLAIYVSFNKYLRLEPLLHRNADAIQVFQAWVLSSIIIEADNLSRQMGGTNPLDIPTLLNVERKALERLIDHLERQIDRTDADDETMREISIDRVAVAITTMCEHYGRSRSVVLLDDAALTLTPEYMVEFFDIVRVLKRSNISPKASVYPGSTEYGPRFHANHEGKTIPVWLPVDNERYLETMRAIAEKRYPDVTRVPTDVDQLLAYAAFGIPRAYLTMLRHWNDNSANTEQQTVNQIIQDYNKLRLSEYRSLRIKVLRLSNLVDVGEELFTRSVDAIKIANEEMGREEKQLVIGLETNGLTPIINRMINLLIEAGLLYEYATQVSHGGTDRIYRRFTTHIAALLAVRAFSGRSRSGSPRQIVSILKLPSTKHPVRRKIDTLLTEMQIAMLRFNLPPCQTCQTARMNETQRFCHACGAKLIAESTFNNCIKSPIDMVPNLTEWTINKLRQSGFETAGDVDALADPGTELRKIWQVGPKRAAHISTAVKSYIDEYLS